MGFAGLVEPVTGDAARVELAEGELVREAAWSLRQADRDRDRRGEHLARCRAMLDAITLLRAERP
jgi:hypothetical protein